METSVLVNLIQTAGYEAYSYSGRGMMGRQCVGLTCSDVNTAIADLFEACMSQDMEEDALADEHVKSVSQVMEEHSALCDALRSSAQDSMGMDKVLYFKSVEWQDEQD